MKAISTHSQQKFSKQKNQEKWISESDEQSNSPIWRVGLGSATQSNSPNERVGPITPSNSSIWRVGPTLVVLDWTSCLLLSLAGSIFRFVSIGVTIGAL
ncbi:hypothetical protein DY000_02040770 [Brassica cretica]|uniref:Uncharacterized protein n=1 Tax=Brassica cretica TaxID=69181 RepID=A0ABQ7BIP5_BRACR|nr:hypothetical protein DY000_02040770 [Brassica cretica]